MGLLFYFFFMTVFISLGAATLGVVKAGTNLVCLYLLVFFNPYMALKVCNDGWKWLSLVMLDWRGSGVV